MFALLCETFGLPAPSCSLLSSPCSCSQPFASPSNANRSSIASCALGSLVCGYSRFCRSVSISHASGLCPSRVSAAIHQLRMFVYDCQCLIIGIINRSGVIKARRKRFLGRYGTCDGAADRSLAGRLSWVHRQRRIPIRRCAWRSMLTAPHRRSSSRRCATHSFRRRRLLSYAWSAWVGRRSRFTPTPTSYLFFRAGPSDFSRLCRRCSWRVPRSPWLPSRASRCRSLPPIPHARTYRGY